MEFLTDELKRGVKNTFPLFTYFYSDYANSHRYLHSNAQRKNENSSLRYHLLFMSQDENTLHSPEVCGWPFDIVEGREDFT